MIRRFVLGVVVLLVLLVATLALFVSARQNLRFERPFPAVQASADPAVIERGRYVVRTLAVCEGCHGDPSVKTGEAPLSGSRLFDIPPGKFYAPNLTPDPETGLGNVPDGAIARALRNNIGHDGRALLPFMTKQGLADDDLVAVVSYLRSQPPVHNLVPAHAYNLLGRVVKATVLANPVGPKAPPPAAAPRGATVENGRYLVETLVDCGGCHTAQDMRTGAVIGPAFGGSTGFDANAEGSWSPPNITRGGRLANLDENAFVARFRTGRLIENSPMPWEAFSGMDEADLRAIHMFLMSQPPVTRDMGPAYVKKEKTSG